MLAHRIDDAACPETAGRAFKSAPIALYSDVVMLSILNPFFYPLCYYHNTQYSQHLPILHDLHPSRHCVSRQQWLVKHTYGE